MQIKRMSILAGAMALLCACGGGGGGDSSTPATAVASNIISVLNESVATAKSGTAIRTLEAVDEHENGAIEVTIPTFAPAGNVVDADESLLLPNLVDTPTVFNENNVAFDNNRGYYFKEDNTVNAALTSLANPLVDGGTAEFYQYDLVAVGGKKSNLQYADFGYWYQEIHINKLRDNTDAPLSAEGKWVPSYDTFLVYKDGDVFATNTALNFGGGAQVFKGSTLGVATLTDNTTSDLVGIAPFEGDITLNVSNDTTFSGNMALSLVDTGAGTIHNWATLNWEGGAINPVTGALSLSEVKMQSLTVSGGNITNGFVLAASPGTALATTFSANMLGTTGNDVKEIVGSYDITGKVVSNKYVTIEGVFGASRK